MYNNDHVIAAYSGGRLPAAIGIVRLTGAGSLDILKGVFLPKRGKPITDSDNNKMIYGELLASDGRTLDICMACWYRAPHSYTGEDMAEIFCHGSEGVVAGCLEALFSAGARMAEAGEFTRRAFLNGKMDLSEAEAVADLIYSRSQWAAKNAAAQLKGANTRILTAMREDLLALISHFYAVCDYSDEDIEPFEYQNAREVLAAAIEQLRGLYDGYLRSSALLTGIPVAVIGRPNVGKSSLFNRLAGFERAIVTHEEGTTRDVVGQPISIGGRQINLMDTAGIRAGESQAERMGIDRSREAAQDASLVVAVFDGSRGLSPEDDQIIDLCRGKRAFAVVNKMDVAQSQLALPEGVFEEIHHISALTGEGTGGLVDALDRFAREGDDGRTLVTSQRQAQLIRQAMDSLEQALESAGQGMTADAFLLDAERGARYIGQIMGLDVDIDITEGIFSRFCVGK